MVSTYIIIITCVIYNGYFCNSLFNIIFIKVFSKKVIFFTSLMQNTQTTYFYNTRQRQDTDQHDYIMQLASRMMTNAETAQKEKQIKQELYNLTSSNEQLKKLSIEQLKEIFSRIDKILQKSRQADGAFLSLIQKFATYFDNNADADKSCIVLKSTIKILKYCHNPAIIKIIDEIVNLLIAGVIQCKQNIVDIVQMLIYDVQYQFQNEALQLLQQLVLQLYPLEASQYIQMFQAEIIEIAQRERTLFESNPNVFLGESIPLLLAFSNILHLGCKPGEYFIDQVERIINNSQCDVKIHPQLTNIFYFSRAYYSQQPILVPHKIKIINWIARLEDNLSLETPETSLICIIVLDIIDVQSIQFQGYVGNLQEIARKISRDPNYEAAILLGNVYKTIFILSITGKNENNIGWIQNEIEMFMNNATLGEETRLLIVAQTVEFIVEFIFYAKEVQMYLEVFIQLLLQGVEKLWSRMNSKQDFWENAYVQKCLCSSIGYYFQSSDNYLKANTINKIDEFLNTTWRMTNSLTIISFSQQYTPDQLEIVQNGVVFLTEHSIAAQNAFERIVHTIFLNDQLDTINPNLKQSLITAYNSSNQLKQQSQITIQMLENNFNCLQVKSQLVMKWAGWACTKTAVAKVSKVLFERGFLTNASAAFIDCLKVKQLIQKIEEFELQKELARSASACCGLRICIRGCSSEGAYFIFLFSPHCFISCANQSEQWQTII